MAQAGPGYIVKSIEPVAIGSDVQARIFTLAPREQIPWHFHSAVSDSYFVLEGTLSIETRAPRDSRVLAVGERFTIAPGGKGMSALVTVEDPDTFNAPLTMTRRWFKVEGAIRETVCAENNEDFFNQNLFPQPEAKTPDF